MTYQQTIDYLFSQLPMYQRIGKAAYKADLNNTIAICNLLDHPYRNFKSIHIAGTNGKGSTAHLIASVLQEQGIKTGLYTSPHLKDFRERIKINGTMIPEQEVVDFVLHYGKEFEKIGPSFFEMTVGLAFWHFSKEQVEIAVLETGMGGRLDSTNVITPLVSVITNIGYDHTQFLGDTLQKIAGEKGGIIKPGVPVVIGETHDNTAPVFREIAEKLQAPIYFADQLIKQDDYDSDLSGAYQRHNRKTALQALKVLKKQGLNVKEESIRNGFQNVIKNTGLSGRWQILSQSPLTICDTGHNKEGLSYVLKQLQSTPHEHLHIVWGMVNDKEPDVVLQILPEKAAYYFCKANIPRARDASELRNCAKKHGLHGEVYSSVQEALNAARKKAAINDLVFVGGSTFVVAEVV